VDDPTANFQESPTVHRTKSDPQNLGSKHVHHTIHRRGILSQTPTNSHLQGVSHFFDPATPIIMVPKIRATQRDWMTQMWSGTSSLTRKVRRRLRMAVIVSDATGANTTRVRAVQQRSRRLLLLLLQLLGWAATAGSLGASSLTYGAGPASSLGGPNAWSRSTASQPGRTNG
jgi:hypothetical protein